MLAWHVITDDAPAPPACVFLHGFLGNAHEWTGTAGALAPLGPLAAIDLPGHGDSWPVTQRTWEDLGAQFSALLQSHQIDRTSLIGYSMGGRLALFLALRNPERYSALVLESASPGLRTAEEAHNRLHADLELAHSLEQIALEDEPEGAFRLFLSQWYEQAIFGTRRKDPCATQRLIEQRLDSDPLRLAAGLRLLSVGAQPSLWEELPNLQVPTLLIVGEEDRKFCRIAEEMCERCPRMAMEVFSGCSHNVHWENPGGYTTAVKAFLQATG